MPTTIFTASAVRNHFYVQKVTLGPSLVSPMHCSGQADASETIRAVSQSQRQNASAHLRLAACILKRMKHVAVFFRYMLPMQY